MEVTTESIPTEDSGGVLHKHISGDDHSARGFHYECALRCLWLLELKGTKNHLAVAEGEDAKIYRYDGRIIYRQAKKREGQHWVYDKSFQEFVERAYTRFSVDPSIYHEFYTNQAIPSGRYDLCDRRHLNAVNSRIRASVPLQTESFCKTVSFFPELYQPDPSLMLLIVKGRLRDLIDSAYPGCQANNFVSDQEVEELAAKLLMFEYGLWSRNDPIGWSEIDAELGMDRLISELYFRSMANGTLTQLDWWPTVDNGGPDDEKTRAIEAERDRRIFPRPKIENLVWALIDEWWAGIGKGGSSKQHSDYLVVVLAGIHGTGKTWNLVHIGNQIQTRYNGVCVCVAAATPPGCHFAFGNLAISQPGPCAILIDDLFPDWSGLVSSIMGPPPQPLLILGTAMRPADDDELRGLTERLGRRIKIVEIPDHVDDTEAESLARVRGVSLSVNERNRAKSTNIRNIAKLLSGTSAPEHLNAMLGLLSSMEKLDLVGPILLFSSLRVAVPKKLFERSVGRSLPLELQSYVLGYRGTTGELLSLEDPDEAAELLTKVLGGASAQRMQEWCERFVQHIDPERPVERAFTRHLFRRLAAKKPKLCEYLLGSCGSMLDAVMGREPLWALIFSWLPMLAHDRRKQVRALALAKVKVAPATVAEIAVLIEAYDTSVVREYLKARLEQLAPWNPELLTRFIETVMALPKNERQYTAMKLTSLLVDLPMDSFVETLSHRNCFNESTSLASDYGKPDDRRFFFHRIGEMIMNHLESGRILKQNWFESYLVLTNRIILQPRFGLSMEIVRQMFIKSNKHYKAVEYYKNCFDQEQVLVYRPLISLGLKLLQQDSDLRLRDSLPPVTGSLVGFAASWADEEEWLAVSDAFIKLLESLSTRKVSFDRLSSMVLPNFSGIHRGPQKHNERFLKAILSWIPDETRYATLETAKLVLQILGFVATQSWMMKTFQAMARKTLLELVSYDDGVEKMIGTLFEALRANIMMPDLGSLRVRMPIGWIDHSMLANTYMKQIGRIQWDEQERMAVAKQLIRTWKGMVGSGQYLIEALLSLGAIEEAKKFTDDMAKNVPTYPDPLGYLAIISAKMGDLSGAEKYLAETVRMHDEHRCGIHPHLAYWVFSQLASISVGRHRVIHLLCAELCRDRPLRQYDEVVNQPML